VVQDVLVERQVALHGVRPQGLHRHDVVDVAARPGHPVVQSPHPLVGIVVGDGGNPGHDTSLASRPNGKAKSAGLDPVSKAPEAFGAEPTVNGEREPCPE